MISMRKKQVPVEERRRRSVQVMDRLLALPRFRNAKNILFYWAMQDEVSTQDTVLRCALEGKNVFRLWWTETILGYAASTEGRLWCRVSPIPSRNLSRVRRKLVYRRWTWWWCPEWLSEADGGRMGRGKGFYDRLLAGTEAGRDSGVVECGVRW